MKSILITLTLILGVCVGTLINSPAADAAKSHTGPRIQGSWYYLVTETRCETDAPSCELGVLQHCETHGVANIFSDGTMKICGPTMCNGMPYPPEGGDFTYVFDGDDEILITEAPITVDPTPTHCKILDRGRMMLCDGGQRGDYPPLWTWAGTLVKMKNKPDPDLLADCL